MSGLRLDDDFFSPVRFDASIIDESSDCSEGSLNNFSSFGELTDAFQNKVTLEKRSTKSVQENECEKGSESMNICTPVSNKNVTDDLNAKRQSLKLKLDKMKDLKTAAMGKQNVISQQKMQESLNRGNILDSQTPKSNSSNKLLQKKSKSATLLSSKHDDNSLKDIKKKQKGNGQSSKHSCVAEEHKSNYEQSVGRKTTGNSSKSLESISDNFKDSSVMSSVSKESTSSNSSVNKKLDDNVSQQIDAITVNPFHTSYEASIKKMISNSISSETVKVRQLMYMQQMSFYREMGKIKDKMEKQHLVTTESLFKVIEELMQMNASLKLALSSKN